LVLVSFLFKLSAVPFHNWAPDVYHGSPYVVILIFLTLPKIVMVFLLVKFSFLLDKVNSGL